MPKANEGNTGFLPEEREWIDIYLDHGFKDIFRELYPDREQYTWWTYRMNARERNVGWRLDYFLISEALVDHVEDVIIHDDVMGSDHCPVSLRLNLNFDPLTLHSARFCLILWGIIFFRTEYSGGRMGNVSKKDQSINRKSRS